MIVSANGKVMVNGSKTTVSAEFCMIVNALSKSYTEKELKKAVEFGLFVDIADNEN